MHIHCFFDEPIDAGIAQELMKTLVVATNVGKCNNIVKTDGVLFPLATIEIFPKQKKAKKLGSCIGIPYYGNTRRCYYKNKFIDMVEFTHIVKRTRLPSIKKLINLPPCVLWLWCKRISVMRNDSCYQLLIPPVCFIIKQLKAHIVLQTYVH